MHSGKQFRCIFFNPGNTICSFNRKTFYFSTVKHNKIKSSHAYLIPLLLIIQLLSIEQSDAQFPQLYFENITTDDGLSDNTITCIYQDSKGFLWIGTSNGLNKYDGLTFKSFYAKEGDPNSLSGNSIVDIIEDTQGVFWIASRDGGITSYDPQQPVEKQFRQYINDPALSNSIASNRITAIAELNEDYIIFSCESASLGFINKKNQQITYNVPVDTTHTMIDPDAGVKTPTAGGWILHFYTEGDNLFVSKLSGGLQVYNRKSKILLNRNYKEYSGSIQDFEVDKENIWMAVWVSGMYCQKNPLYLKEGEKPVLKKLFETEEEITCVLSLDEHFLLAGSRGAGIYLINKKDYSHTQIKQEKGADFTLSSNRINCMFKDSKGILWIGTPAGLNKYNPVQWQFKSYTINNDSKKDIIHYSVFSYDSNTIGICTSDGIYQFSLLDNSFQLREFRYGNFPLRTTAVADADKNTTYLTTESNSFYYNKQTHAIDILSPKQFYTNKEQGYYTYNAFRTAYQVYDVIGDTVEGKELHIFRTIGSGIGIYDIAMQQYYDIYHSNVPNTLSSNFVRIIYKDSKKNIWVGTSEGLNKWIKSPEIQNNFDVYLHKSSDSNSISNNVITGIYEDKQHRLWISTGNGINEFTGKEFLHYSPDKTTNIPMHGLYADENNNLWTSVRGGFEVFDPEKKSFRFAPLLNNDWMLKNPAQIFRMKNGDWFYGARNQLIRFDPESYYFETEFPEIYLTDFILFDKSIYNSTLFNDLTFSHKENFITINFSCLQLSQPGTVKFKYHLHGLNNEWIETGNSGKINLLSLPPGKYSLQIKVTNPQGDWSDAITLTEFMILHPYWQQWWFIVLCILTGSAIVYTVIKYREKQLKKLYAMRNKIANDLHDDVGSALSTINLYSEVAKMKSIENNEIQNILDKISVTSIEMQENMNHIVWSLQPRNDNFDQMILRMKSFALENLQTKNIITEFLVDEKLNDLKITAAKRQELFLIFKEVIHNIIKYAECTEVKIHFQKINNELHMHISDNGKGFDTGTAFSGNGLHTMRERARQLKGILEIVSKDGKGTHVFLSFKI